MYIITRIDNPIISIDNPIPCIDNPIARIDNPATRIDHSHMHAHAGRGDPEIRRAMNKSFQESGGTVLSTNWGEVGSKTVEGTPPAGLEMKKWKLWNNLHKFS